jgi:hypothetical protein
MESGWLGGVRGTTGGVADGDTIEVNAICGAGAYVSDVEAIATDVNVVGGADCVGGAATIRTATGVGGGTGMGIVEDEAAGAATGDAGAGGAADGTGDAGLMVPRTDAAATDANWLLKVSTKLGHEIAPRFCSIQRNQM